LLYRAIQSQNLKKQLSHLVSLQLATYISGSVARR
jgi:hypothetical protein